MNTALIIVLGTTIVLFTLYLAYMQIMPYLPKKWQISFLELPKKEEEKKQPAEKVQNPDKVDLYK
jgi:hypothetical protein